MVMQSIEECHRLTVGVYQRTVEILSRLRRSGWSDEQEVWVTGELEEAIEEAGSDGVQTPNPRVVLASMIWGKLHEDGLGLGDFELVRGLLGSHEHAWFELVFTDRRYDPLPKRWIIDPAPPGCFLAALPLGPDAPYLLLYQRR